MGEWQAVKVEWLDSEVPQKEALQLLEDAFLNSKFYFKGNYVFRIKFDEMADKRLEELKFLD